jgi:hypothetical protein
MTSSFWILKQSRRGHSNILTNLLPVERHKAACQRLHEGNKRVLFGRSARSVFHFGVPTSQR